MAMRQDLGLSWLLGISVPVLLVCVLAVISRMVPQFRLMQERIDNINRVLREQITGIRVVRAFVREPEETRRFEQVNAELTHTSLVAGRAAFKAALDAGMPPVEVADVVFGANRSEQFYILTHPEWTEVIQLRTDKLLRMENPQSPAATIAKLINVRG